jgi:hypothetical protein
MTDLRLFNESCERIDRAYHRLGHRLGYRFLLGSRDNLGPETEILFLGLNPGGRSIPPDHPADSCEDGPAFVRESWGAGRGPGSAPLQVQVQRMFDDLAAQRNNGMNGRALMEHSLLAYYIPFRSPNMAELSSPHE